MKNMFVFVCVLAVPAVAVISALDQLHSPIPLPGSAAPTVFSAGRARMHLNVIAARPHMVGSQAQSNVRDYIIDELRKVGLSPVVQKTTAIASDGRIAVVQNIVATIKGANTSKAVCLGAHYDAAPLAPGASDNGISVASMLETARAIKNQAPLRNDIILLYTDGEENGLLGAKAFADDTLRATNIGIVLNFDGRGSSGPSIMFRTGSENGKVVREFDKAISRKMSTSFVQSLMEYYPGNTDFRYLRQIADGGLDFATVGSLESYHTVHDKLEHVDLGTLQQHGDNMLAVAVHFANLDLHAVGAPDVTFFSFLFSLFIIYPLAWNIPLAVLTTILFLIAGYLGLRRRKLSVRKVFLGFIISTLRVVVASVVVYFLWNALGPTRPEFNRYVLQHVYTSGYFLFGFLAVALVVSTFFQHLCSEKLGWYAGTFGGSLLWLVILWLSVFYLPGGCYVFLWPLCCVLLSSLYLQSIDNVTLISRLQVVLLVASLVPGILIFTNAMYLLFEVFSMMSVAVIAALLVLLLGTMQLPLTIATRQNPWSIPALASVFAIVFILLGLYSRQTSDKYPEPDSILYFLDADSSKAFWFTWDDKADDWLRQFFPSGLEKGSLARFIPNLSWTTTIGYHDAPIISHNDPVVKVLSDHTDGTSRNLKLQIRSSAPHDSEVSFILVNPVLPEAVREVRVNGKKLEYSSLPWPLWLHGIFDEVYELELKTEPTAPIRLQIVEALDGLPIQASRGLAPRPSWTIPRHFVLTDLRIVSHTFSL